MSLPPATFPILILATLFLFTLPPYLTNLTTFWYLLFVSFCKNMQIHVYLLVYSFLHKAYKYCICFLFLLNKKNPLNNMS